MIGPEPISHFLYPYDLFSLMLSRYFLGYTMLVLAVISCGCMTQAPLPVPTVSPTITLPEKPMATADPKIPQTIHNTTWKLGWYDDTNGIWSSVISGSSITALFGIDEKVRGSGGCNEYSSEFHIGNDQMLWIRRPGNATSQCSTPTGVMHQESEYFTDLSRSQAYSISQGQLLIFDREGRKILQFDPTPG